MIISRALILAGALALSVPAIAQDNDAAGTATAQQNLDCAIWSSYQTGSATDDDVKNGLAIAVAWFVGLYEGQTGELISDAFAVRTAELSEEDVIAMTSYCVGRFSEFGDRLSNLGDRIDAQEQ